MAIDLPLSGMPQIHMVAKAAGGDGQIPPEHQLKSIYLYNFLNFVHWPSEHCGAMQGNPRKIVVVGNSPFEDALKALQVKLNNEGKPDLSIVFAGPYHEDMDLRGCYLLFICASEQEKFDKIIASVAGKPVLTVTDNEKLVDAGGMITMISYQNRIRWAINLNRIWLSGLKVDGQLLDVAVKILE